jgi:hypothetical protein
MAVAGRAVGPTVGIRSIVPLQDFMAISVPQILVLVRIAFPCLPANDTAGARKRDEVFE